jgi:hypothetical protein
MIELSLKKHFHIPERAIVNITDLITKTSEHQILGEIESALVLALYKLRGVGEHGKLSKDEVRVAKALLMASIPLLSRLRHSKPGRIDLLEVIEGLPHEDAILGFAKKQTEGQIMATMDQTFSRLSLVHNFQQLDRMRNHITYVKAAVCSRISEEERIRVFDHLHKWFFKPKPVRIGRERVYEVIKGIFDDITVMEHVIDSGQVNAYVKDLHTTTNYADGKTRSEIIALFEDKLSIQQKLKVVDAILSNNQLLRSSGARKALGKTCTEVASQLSKKSLLLLKDNEFLDV